QALRPARRARDWLGRRGRLDPRCAGRPGDRADRLAIPQHAAPGPAQHAHCDAAQPWDQKAYRMPGGTPASPKIASALAVAPAMLAQKTRGLYPATQAILEAMVEGALVDYDSAVRIEARKLAKVMVGQNAKNMIQAFFFDLQAIRSGKA